MNPTYDIATGYTFTWTLPQGGASSAKGLGATKGPLTMGDLVATKIPTSNIPLLGCGGPGDPGEAILSGHACLDRVRRDLYEGR